ncbi:CobW C-terminal domain-containing protein [Mycolicibacterium insubricum]|uniref:GTP-binding protein n=1 Tax=Mycolicibacterium insubricum TaxID=444597 RepID=UPI0021F2D9A1|nr:GTP-binding protein [Mycolicibacterium insubricum]
MASPPSRRRVAAGSPHDPLLDGQPPLEPAGRVSLVEFYARRPFHPGRLDAALGLLLEGVVRTRGRMWLANNIIEAMWLETAGGGWRATSAGKWLAAMDTSELAYVAPERRALADVGWDRVHGDRHTALTALVCGADPDEIFAALSCALLTDAEMDNPGEWSDYGDPFEGWSETDCTTDDLVSSGEDGDHR